MGTVLDNPNGDISEERFIGDVDVSGDRDTNSYRLGYDLEHQFSENWKLRMLLVLYGEKKIALL